MVNVKVLRFNLIECNVHKIYFFTG